MLLGWWLTVARAEDVDPTVGDIGTKPTGALPSLGGCVFPGSRWTKPEIDAHVQMVMGRVQLCYSHSFPKKRLFRRTPVVEPLSGVVHTRFVIGTDGAVEASVKSSELAPGERTDTLHTCLVDALEHMEFEPSNSQTIVSYPFRFTP